jgi:6-phosphofructokinase 1
MNIGVLTGGGDCPGLNAAIRAVVRTALPRDYKVTGIKNGWAGVLSADSRELDDRAVSGILPLGGTILGTSRTNPMKMERGMERLQEGFKSLGLDVLVAIGGDDTLSVAHRLFQLGVPTVGVPKTMDNDVFGTDYCIGFDSAVSTATDALDKLHTTASSHHRVMVLEVMGRDAGWVAVFAGIAGGADYILIPEVDVPIQDVCDHLTQRRAKGRDFSIIVVAEGANSPDLPPLSDEENSVDAFGHVRLDRRGIGERVGREIEKRTKMETRVTVLGHVQRGGSPTVFDRMLATRLGVAAVQYIQRGMYGVMPALHGSNIEPIDLATAVSQNRRLNVDLYDLAKTFF